MEPMEDLAEAAQVHMRDCQERSADYACTRRPSCPNRRSVVAEQRVLGPIESLTCLHAARTAPRLDSLRSSLKQRSRASERAILLEPILGRPTG
jgi:hypothetical protein